MLNIGDFAFDTTTGTNVQVLEKIDVWGYVSYKVFNPATGKVYKVSEEQLNIESSGFLYDENYLRYVTLLSKIKTRPQAAFCPLFPAESFRCRTSFMCSTAQWRRTTSGISLPTRWDLGKLSRPG